MKGVQLTVSILVLAYSLQLKIAPEDLEQLQRSLVLSHAAGVGVPLDDAMVRLIMLLKANSLARGFTVSVLK